MSRHASTSSKPEPTSKPAASRASTARHVVISDEEHQLPYSKGLMASSIMATGLAPARAFHVAECIEDRLQERRASTITRAELVELARQTLVDEVGERYADSFVSWQVINRVETPLIILIGGATGVGKSTIATQLAARIGITRIIPTDAIREVMRSMLRDDLLPSLHASSFDEPRTRVPPPPDADPVVIAYREQSSAVAVGIRALVKRAVAEGTDLVIEGAHVVPGLFDPKEYDEAVLVPFVVTIDDAELHRSHFMQRGRESHRGTNRYLRSFDNIRKIQQYVKSLAMEHDTPIVASYNLDATLSQVIDLVVSAAVQAAEPTLRSN